MTDKIEVMQGDRFYIDCEFDGHDGPLLSLAMIRDDGDSIHIKTTAPISDDWVFANVLPLMDSHNARKSASVSLNEVGGVIRSFIGDCTNPIIIADSPVDIGRFCRALSTGGDGGWASADYPGMTFEVHNVDCYPTDLPGAVQHNAWWDAMALRHRLASTADAQPVAVQGLVEALIQEIAERQKKEPAIPWFIHAREIARTGQLVPAQSGDAAMTSAKDAEITRLREFVGHFAAQLCWCGIPGRGKKCHPCNARQILALAERKEAP